MPIVTIRVTREGTTPGASSVTSEQKAALIKGASELLLDVLNKPLEATFVGAGAGCRLPSIERGSQTRQVPNGFSISVNITIGGTP